MRHIFAFLAVILAALVPCTVWADPAPLADYGSLPSLSNVSLSPDGHIIAYCRATQKQRVIVIQAIGTPTPLAVLRIGAQKLRGLTWADDDHLLIITSVTALPLGLIGHRQEYAMAQSYDLKANTIIPLLRRYSSFNQDVPIMNVIAGLPRTRVINGHTDVFVRGIYFPDRQARLALFRVDLATDQTTMVSDSDDIQAENWLIDRNGHIIAEEDYDEGDQHWSLGLHHHGMDRTVMDVAAPIDAPAILGQNRDQTALILQLPDTGNWPSYERISLKDGTSSPWPYANLHLDTLLTDSRTGRIIGGPHFTDRAEYTFFNPHTEMVWRSILAAFKGATNVALVSWSEDRNRAVVLVFGPQYGDTYYFVDMSAHKASPIGPAYNGITEIAPETWISYAAEDGRRFHAYLTLPLNRAPRQLPLIVVPHGGPHARDEPGFDWISQALASRGYAVLQPQFRGSAGFGDELLRAGFGQFGRKMQTDLSDGVKALAAQGLIDPKRVCIVGGSYGGYAALAGATLQSGIYRCAVSIAGISDLGALLSHWDWPHNTLDDRNARFWDRFLGVNGPDDPRLNAISPIKHVDRVEIPILLIHGRDDTIVPFSQSQDMADALKAAGKAVEFVKLDGEDHWLSKGATRRQMLKATVTFLEAHNPPSEQASNVAAGAGSKAGPER